MRTGLLSDLSVIGYEVFLEGETIRLRYQKPDTPPDTVRPLIDELRRCKAEVVNILKMGDPITPTPKKQSRVNVNSSWSPEAQSLIDWFSTLDVPTAPFYLEEHRKVIDPRKFFDSLRQEIAIGPSCPRGRNGALLCDLNTLRKKMH